MKNTICKSSGHHIQWDAGKIWVNSGVDGHCLGRFTPLMGGQAEVICRLKPNFHFKAPEARNEQEGKERASDCFQWWAEEMFRIYSVVLPAEIILANRKDC